MKAEVVWTHGRFTGAQLCSDCMRLGEYVKDKGKCLIWRRLTVVRIMLQCVKVTYG